MIPRIMPVDATMRDAFIGYALVRGPEHDESWVGPEDLATFDPAEEPAALALDEQGEVVGAASLMLRGYAGEGMARLRILHATETADQRQLPRRLGGCPGAYR